MYWNIWKLIGSGVGPSVGANRDGFFQRSTTFMSDILDAVKTKDSRRAEQLIGSLVIENDAPWFAAQFSAETGELLRAAYKQSMKDFVSTTRELYAADIRRGPINIRVNRYDDPNRAPQPIPELLQSMNAPEPLYEVSLSGARTTFQIALPPNGGPGRVVAGDLDGYFIDTPGGFRFIPSNVLQVAARERQKNKYEVLGRDADGRPTRIRTSAAALAGLIIERVQSQYPRAARQKKVEGEVMVSAVVGANGRVQEVTVISGPPELHDAAVDAMKKWRFKPFQLDGRAVEVESKFVFNYAIAN
jgi:TonB family protein